MLRRVNLHMPAQVIVKHWGSILIDGQFVQKPTKHHRNYLLPTVAKGCGNSMKAACSKLVECIVDKLAGGRRDLRASQCQLDPPPIDQLQEPLNGTCVCANFPHGGDVNFEVTGVAAQSAQLCGQLVAFLRQQNFVYQADQLRVFWGAPWPMSGGQTRLKGFDQRHEVPHSKNVMLHENAQRANCLDLAKQRVLRDCGQFGL